MEPPLQPSVIHSTRLRLPSSRLRQSPDPPPRLRKILPSPQINFPPFPPENVTLHPDDANSKVLTAIARALLSVDNRAMTIKDLTEMTAQFGLVCQNLSATSQAITSYIRTHLHRCEVQQDQPLLLRHVLSGTSADDHLLPALYSRSGGAHVQFDKSKIKEDTPRLTNFRKGTMVWYLSRITGAPCPFTRVGIRLCDYLDPDRSEAPDGKKLRGQKERESRRLAMKAEEQCGQKRKRELRGSPSDGESGDAPPPLTKPKLTLRIKRPVPRASVNTVEEDRPGSSPASNSNIPSDDSVSSGEEPLHGPRDSHDPLASTCVLPPYPRRSISIPKYKPLIDYQSCSSYPSCYTYRRSPSIPYSVASFPPDSDEDDDSSDIDAASVPSPPRSPSIPFLPLISSSSTAGYSFEPRVKEEPTDVQGILDAWEDLDHLRNMEYDVKPVIPETTGIEREDIGFDTWDRDSTSPFSMPIKQEDLDIMPSLYPLHLENPDLSFHNWRATSPDGGDAPSPVLLSPVSALSPTSPFQEQSLPFSPVRNYEDATVTVRPRAMTVPCLPGLDGFFQSVQPSDPTDTSSVPQSLAALIESLTVSIDTTSPPQSPVTCVSPTQMDIRVCTHTEMVTDDSFVLPTCEPSDPEILFMQLEGVPVFRMKLGCHVVLRRFDTGFVTLGPLVALSKAPRPMCALSFHVEKGSDSIRGDWLPLLDAQAYIKDFPISSKEGQGLHLFLSQSLPERFPNTISAFIPDRTDADRVNGSFGPSFGSMVQAGQVITQAQSTKAPPFPPDVSHLADPTLVTDAPPAPLSATEEEIFRAFLVSSEWDKENVSSASVFPSGSRVASKPLTIITTSNALTQDSFDIDDEPLTPLSSSPCSIHSVASFELSRSGKPLRRSKRVRDAAAAAAKSKTKTRSRNKC